MSDEILECWKRYNKILFHESDGGCKFSTSAVAIAAAILVLTEALRAATPIKHD